MVNYTKRDARNGVCGHGTTQSNRRRPLEAREIDSRTNATAALFDKRSKCEFKRASLSFLGHVVGQCIVEMQQSKVQALADWPRLTANTEVQSFLGLANYYRRLIRDFARVSAPLSELTKKGVPFEGGRPG
jgi:hypothetical protein